MKSSTAKSTIWSQLAIKSGRIGIEMAPRCQDCAGGPFRHEIDRREDEITASLEFLHHIGFRIQMLLPRDEDEAAIGDTQIVHDPFDHGLALHIDEGLWLGIAFLGKALAKPAMGMTT